jgi:hypothetical protein
MSSKQAILTNNAPKPLPGIYSQAIVANGFVYCSGQVPMDPSTGKLVEGDVQAHTVRDNHLHHSVDHDIRTLMPHSVLYSFVACVTNMWA